MLIVVIIIVILIVIFGLAVFMLMKRKPNKINGGFDEETEQEPEQQEQEQQEQEQKPEQEELETELEQQEQEPEQPEQEQEQEPEQPEQQPTLTESLITVQNVENTKLDDIEDFLNKIQVNINEFFNVDNIKSQFKKAVSIDNIILNLMNIGNKPIMKEITETKLFLFEGIRKVCLSIISNISEFSTKILSMAADPISILKNWLLNGETIIRLITSMVSVVKDLDKFIRQIFKSGNMNDKFNMILDLIKIRLSVAYKPMIAAMLTAYKSLIFNDIYGYFIKPLQVFCDQMQIYPLIKSIGSFLSNIFYKVVKAFSYENIEFIINSIIESIMSFLTNKTNDAVAYLNNKLKHRNDNDVVDDFEGGSITDTLINVIKNNAFINKIKVYIEENGERLIKFLSVFGNSVLMSVDKIVSALNVVIIDLPEQIITNINAVFSAISDKQKICDCIIKHTITILVSKSNILLNEAAFNAVKIQINIPKLIENINTQIIDIIDAWVVNVVDANKQSDATDKSDATALSGGFIDFNKLAMLDLTTLSAFIVDTIKFNIQQQYNLTEQQLIQLIEPLQTKINTMTLTLQEIMEMVQTIQYMFIEIAKGNINEIVKIVELITLNVDDVKDRVMSLSHLNMDQLNQLKKIIIN